MGAEGHHLIISVVFLSCAHHEVVPHVSLIPIVSGL